MLDRLHGTKMAAKIDKASKVMEEEVKIDPESEKRNGLECPENSTSLSETLHVSSTIHRTTSSHLPLKPLLLQSSDGDGLAVFLGLNMMLQGI